MRSIALSGVFLIAIGSIGCQDNAEIAELQDQVSTLKREKRFALNGWNREEREVERLQSRLSVLRGDLAAAEEEQQQLRQTVDELSAPPLEYGEGESDLARCHPAYTSECLDPSYDYDCGNNEWQDDGPGYVFAPIELMQPGNDPYGLDMDGNGIGCEEF